MLSQLAPCIKLVPRSCQSLSLQVLARQLARSLSQDCTCVSVLQELASRVILEYVGREGWAIEYWHAVPLVTLATRLEVSTSTVPEQQQHHQHLQQIDPGKEFIFRPSAYLNSSLEQPPQMSCVLRPRQLIVVLTATTTTTSSFCRTPKSRLASRVCVCSWPASPIELVLRRARLNWPPLARDVTRNDDKDAGRNKCVSPWRILTDKERRQLVQDALLSAFHMSAISIPLGTNGSCWRSSGASKPLSHEAASLDKLASYLLRPLSFVLLRGHRGNDTREMGAGRRD